MSRKHSLLLTIMPHCQQIFSPAMARVHLIFFLVSLLICTSANAKVPSSATAFLNDYCMDCHDAETMKGEISLEYNKLNWSDADTKAHWERVMNAVSKKDMPPRKKRNQPTQEERDAFTAWVDKELIKHSKIGGTYARRLNRDEYERTIASLFGTSFDLPPGFPADSEGHGFDNVGESLILSPPLMNAYAETAAMVADEIFPPARPPAKSTEYQIPAEDMVISYSSGSIRNGAMRLVSKCESIMRSCTWPSKVEAKASGIYKVTLTASQFAPKSNQPHILNVLVRDVASADSVDASSLRVVKEITINSESPETFEFEATLFKGQTIVLHYANAPLDSTRVKKEELKQVFVEKFKASPRYLAGWQEMVKSSDQGFRGGVGWERVKALIADDSLDLSNATMDSEETEKLLKRIVGNPVLFTETIAYDHFENGPGLDLHHIQITGPISIVDGPEDQKRKRVQTRFVGARNQRSDKAWAKEILTNFLSKAFRRPADKETVDAYLKLVESHWAEGNSFENGFHLAIRTALISPRFLYRSLKPGKLDDYDLAARLSYFLTSRPPDDKLLKHAAKGHLGDPKILQKEAERLLPKKYGDAFVRNFIGQWLDTRLLSDIMPDPRLKFSADDQSKAQMEAEAFFHEMLTKNRSMTDFIDPDFTYTSASIAKKIYGLKDGYNKKSRSLQRVSLERGSRHGGVLGQAAVMMATANGVDTQPVIRGVWVLENIIGDPPPPPPMAVPAITPDTTGAKSPKDLLKAHASETSCAGCHKKIDPIGFALENFDAVGRWRTHYPIDTTNAKGQRVTEDGPEIDSTGQLPDGTQLNDVTDLKRWLVANVDQFSECLSEKLLTYATGRPPNYVERKEIEHIVESNHANGNGFKDLLLALIQSESFLTK